MAWVISDGKENTKQRTKEEAQTIMRFCSQFWNWDGFAKVTSDMGSLLDILEETKTFENVQFAKLLVLTSSMVSIY
ncbi:hypothetical protein VNO78_02578 [Psophocarpus tetragonolobus]|uniref:Uncharacterized protein n=1 Tax=Psophocarpus tetragonolobus TaxID=3891 RepID=A0AAN9TAW5_PSOTE